MTSKSILKEHAITSLKTWFWLVIGGLVVMLCVLGIVILYILCLRLQVIQEHGRTQQQMRNTESISSAHKERARESPISENKSNLLNQSTYKTFSINSQDSRRSSDELTHLLYDTRLSEKKQSGKIESVSLNDITAGDLSRFEPDSSATVNRKQTYCSHQDRIRRFNRRTTVFSDASFDGDEDVIRCSNSLKELTEQDEEVSESDDPSGYYSFESRSRIISNQPSVDHYPYDQRLYPAEDTCNLKMSSNRKDTDIGASDANKSPANRQAAFNVSKQSNVNFGFAPDPEVEPESVLESNTVDEKLVQSTTISN